MLLKLHRIKQLHTMFQLKICKKCFKTVQRYSSSAGMKKRFVVSDDVDSIRNIGIMAHIDAGKTTTTERMLYYAGFSKHLGNVDDGDTVTDYMAQERERGITITSAAVTLQWNKHNLNLIDTPGHVDFMMEVERSLRVLDGAVAVLDAAAGVEAQTLTVWRQANKFSIPRIVFLNKMDKHNANFKRSLKSLRNKLHIEPIVVTLPIGSYHSFSGIIDLVTMQAITWDSSSPDGQDFTTVPIHKYRSDSLIEESKHARTTMIGQLSDIDETIAEYVLNDVDVNDIPVEDVRRALRKATLSQEAVVVLCGSALKNKGIQQLLDAVVHYLPSPRDIHHKFLEYYNNNLCALAFKIIHDKNRGPLTFVRLYGGVLKSGSPVFNVNQRLHEKPSRLLQVNADEFLDIQALGTGNIACLAGLKQTRTGDTLTTNKEVFQSALRLYKPGDDNSLSVDSDRSPTIEGDDGELEGGEVDDGDYVIDENSPILAGVQVPSPVFFCSIEAPSISKQKDLDMALERLQREDPSLQVSVDKDTGQTILSGMGELHIDIIKNRLRDEYRLDAYVGPLQIAYREMIDEPVESQERLERFISGRNHSVMLYLSLHHSEDPVFKKVVLVPDRDGVVKELPWKQLAAINNGVSSALKYGPILHSQVVNVEVHLHDFEMHRGTHLPIISACATKCIQSCLAEATCFLTEPIMAMEIHTDADNISIVLGDLAQRRGQVVSLPSHNDVRVIHALTPLSRLMGYSTDLRSFTSGTATYSMELSHYERLSAEDQQKAIGSASGASYM